MWFCCAPKLAGKIDQLWTIRRNNEGLLHFQVCLLGLPKSQVGAGLLELQLQLRAIALRLARKFYPSELLGYGRSFFAPSEAERSLM